MPYASQQLFSLVMYICKCSFCPPPPPPPSPTLELIENKDLVFIEWNSCFEILCSWVDNVLSKILYAINCLKV